MPVPVIAWGKQIWETDRVVTMLHNTFASSRISNLEEWVFCHQTGIFCLCPKCGHSDPLSLHRRIARGGHGLPKVSPGLPCVTLLRPAGRPPLKQPYGYFRGDRPIGQASAAVFNPLDTPRHTPMFSCLTLIFCFGLSQNLCIFNAGFCLSARRCKCH
jgi:hypothetical protein